MEPDIQTTSSLLTYDDYCHIPNDGRRYEVIEGRLYMSPAPFFRHQKTIRQLLIILDQFVKKHDVGEVIMSPFDVVLSEHNVVQPDILFISKERLSSILTEKNAQGAPDLVVEVLSEGNRRHDEIVKKKLYEEFGVKEYWIADPALETIKIYRLDSGKYVQIAVFESGKNDILETPLLPGFRCELAEIYP